jgi:dGTPase
MAGGMLAIDADPVLLVLPADHVIRKVEIFQKAVVAGRARAVADYIAGMTDRYAILEHQRLFDPSERT